MIGQAIDVRIRGYFAPVTFEGNPEFGLWNTWESGDISPERLWKVTAQLQDRAATLGSPGRRLKLEDEKWFARYCLVLSLFEVFARSGVVAPELRTIDPDAVTAERLLAIPNLAWVDDLCALSWTFYDQSKDVLALPAILNPTFSGSADVGGADADLILDGCLLEIKAAVDLKRNKPEWLYQLLGYVLLDYDDVYGIKTVGLYLARQGRYVCWPLEEYLSILAGTRVTSIAELRSEFRDVTTTKPISAPAYGDR